MFLEKVRQWKWEGAFLRSLLVHKPPAVAASDVAYCPVVCVCVCRESQAEQSQWDTYLQK